MAACLAGRAAVPSGSGCCCSPDGRMGSLETPGLGQRPEKLGPALAAIKARLKGKGKLEERRNKGSGGSVQTLRQPLADLDA